MSLYGYTFQYKGKKTTSFNPRGMPRFMSNCEYHVFRCSQINRTWKLSPTVPATSRRNHPKRERFDCKGFLNVYFPDAISLPENINADIVIKCEHIEHRGAKASGVPLAVCEWIKLNSAKTHYETWDNLMSVIEGGSFPEIDKAYLSPAHVLHWFRKYQIQRHSCSSDPWVNLEAMLKENLKV